MEDAAKSTHAARSRAPLDEAGVKWWDLYGTEGTSTTSQYYVQNESEVTETKMFVNKSTCTRNAQAEIASKNYDNLKNIASDEPKDKVLKEWRDRQARARFEQARKAVINSLKEKFSDVSCSNIHPNTDGNKIDIRKRIPTIIITGDNVEGTSNLNANRDGEDGSDLSLVDGDFKVENAVEGACHARRLQMGPGGGLAQWRLLPRGSRAAGAEGGLRAAKENMPLPSREGLTTPRSARAPISRRPTSALPHQRLKKEKSLETPPEMDSPVGSVSSDLRRQNEELRARLAGEAADHKRRLDAYRRAQQGQAALVSRLQAKVLQYKQRCSELESHMLETTPRSDVYRPTPPKTSIALPASAALPTPSSIDSRKDERINDLETALRRLDEEKRRCEKLVAQNNLLRDQLEESHQLNEALTGDLQKLTNDWEALRDEMTIKEDEWKDEEQAFNDYYSSEHNRLLNLWREVVSVKRQYAELQSSTERDLYRVRNEFDSSARELLGMLSGYSINAFAAQTLKPDSQGAGTSGMSSFGQGQSCICHLSGLGQGSSGQGSTNVGLEALRVDLRDMSSQRDQALAELRERDARIQRLLGELQGLEERCEIAEAQCSDAGVMRAALEDVARALIQDSESDIMPTSHIHLADRSPKRSVPQSANATAFAESTISAVQAALHKYQIQIHELQVKLQNTREQLQTSRKHCEVADNTIGSLESKLQDLQAKLDQANADINQLTSDKESMQKTLEALRGDKSGLERNRVEINAMVESLTSDYEKLQKLNARLEKTIEGLESEKRALNCEVDHLHREGSNRESVLRAEEERSSRLRSELVTVREELNQTLLSRDLLDQQKLEADAVISQMEKHRNELEIELERIVMERADLQDLVEKLETAVRNLECEKKKLLDEVKHLEDEKSSLSNQSSEQQGDLNSLRKELLAAEQNRMELEADKASLYEKIKFLEGEREKVELELRQVVRERGELSSQLTAMVRKKDTLNEEIIRLQQRLEQANETIGRINRALEDHVKDGEEKQILIDSLEKDKQHFQEQLAGVRSEKDALEAVLFDTANMLEDADNKRSKLEHELQETLVQQENYKGQIARLTKDLDNTEKKLRETRNSMSQAAGKKEAEYQQIITNLNRTTTENITKLKEEKDQLRQSLEHKLNQTIAALTSEKESCEAGAREREKKLLAARDQLILQHDEAMLRAENDKQQALIMAHQEQQALLERLEEAKRALDCEANKLERVRRDAQARADHDRNYVNQLKDELAAMKTRLEEAKAIAEDDCARFENRIKELHLEKESVTRECTETRALLSLAEDKYDNAYAQLQETTRKLKELENEADSLRKELTDVRRQLTNCCAERDKYNSSCRELREHVKRAESERRDAARARDEAYHKIAGLEENRTTLELELSRVQNLLKEAESGGSHLTRDLRATEAQLKRERAALEQANHDIKELQSRLQNESEERERCANDAATARRHGAELDAMLASARAELNACRQRGAELEEACRARDQELVLRLEDCRSKERRLEELKHNLEVCLADATQQIQELKARLGGSEGRCRALEASLTQCESGKREVEAKLSSIAHALRRVCGVQPDGSVHAAARRRLASPARRYSPHRGRDHSEDRNEIIDVDPELIKKGMRNLMHDVCQIEREKDDYKSQMNALKKQLKEATEQGNKGEGKLQTVTNNLRSVQEEKARLESTVAQKCAQLSALNESVQTKTVEISNLRDKITSIEATLSAVTEEKVQNENKAESLRVQLAERVQEVGQLREALAAAEGRAARLDVRRAQLEGDIQRAAVAARDRDQALKKLQERCEGYTRTIASLEDRCTSLKGTVEQLSTSLQKAASAESELRAEVGKTQRMLNEAKNNEHNALEKLRQLQKNVSNCENERRVLSEKLESAKTALGELKRMNASLEDQVHRLTNQLANVEVQRSGLESQLRMTTWDGKESSDGELERELHALQRDRSELKAKCDALTETVRKLEAERRMPPRPSALRSKSHDRAEKSVYYSDLDSGPDSTKDSVRCTCYKDSNLKDKSYGDLSLLELENRELRMKIRRLEKELADKESELAMARNRYLNDLSTCSPSQRSDVDRYRQAALQAERLLEAREASHRQQLHRLENQAAQLRAQLSAEIRRRQAYVSRSGRAARDVQRLRAALGDSLRTVSQDPALDSYTLEHEARKLDSTLTHSLPPLNDSYDSSK
ncbi:rootletin isoform X2 [Plodia interpunctella]|uniref:rootletin isoform X2 n=1 Tax=Plodia interpunctella TaxID=58824 RepID=UPI0023676F56|nr:rootletin isoform X2 [Plodia interpunctella]